MGAYDDILHLPHHRSEKHPPMSMRDRAAQFSSFRALAGYEDAIGETARLTDRRIERGEEERHRLDAILRQLECRLAEKPTVTASPALRKTAGESNAIVPDSLSLLHEAKKTTAATAQTNPANLFI